MTPRYRVREFREARHGSSHHPTRQTRYGVCLKVGKEWQLQRDENEVALLYPTREKAKACAEWLNQAENGKEDAKD